MCVVCDIYHAVHMRVRVRVCVVCVYVVCVVCVSEYVICTARAWYMCVRVCVVCVCARMRVVHVPRVCDISKFNSIQLMFQC